MNYNFGNGFLDQIMFQAAQMMNYRQDSDSDEDDYDDDDDDDDEGFTPVGYLDPNSLQAQYYNKWVGLVEYERQQNREEERKNRGTRQDNSIFFDKMKKNIANLCYNSPGLFELIGAGKSPTFNRDSLEDYYPFYKGQLNKDQDAALEKCLQTKQYCIIHGLPGTGKTHVIVKLLRILIESNETVLLSAKTHFAIDNILERFAIDYPNMRTKIVRFATDPERVSRKLRNMITPITSESLGQVAHLNTPHIFAITCDAAANKKLKGLRYHTCIVDESTQAPEPVVLGPLLLSNKFILFGDHFQLQPLVKSREAKEQGMNISLFERLAIKNRNAVSTLTIQYRMNQEIMSFSNEFVYGGEMKCGAGVEKGRLNLSMLPDNGWVRDTLDPKNPVVFLNFTDSDSKKRKDCKLTCYLVQKLISCGLHPSKIGVINPINADVDFIRSEFKKKDISAEVFTIDGCQGIDKECMILDFSLAQDKTRSLLSDWKRVNVAFTRAKHKLIMIGSISDLLTVENINEYIIRVRNTSLVLSVTDNHLSALRI